MSNLSGVTRGTTKIDIPMEFGINTYVNYKVNKFFMPYSGIDIERFSVFNSDEMVLLNERLATREQIITYATLGFSSTFHLFKRKFYFKTSYAHSLYTSSFRKSLISDKNFSSSRIIFYLNTNINKHFFAHILYKAHFMSGPMDLKINRIGIGFGFNIL